MIRGSKQQNIEIVNLNAVIVITIWYLNEVSEARPRKKLEDILHYECW